MAAACGSADATAILQLEVSGLLADDHVSATASSKAGPLDTNFAQYGFTDVGNGVHVSKPVSPGSYHLLCPPTAEVHPKAYDPLEQIEQTVDVAADGTATFRCDYTASKALADVPFDDDQLEACATAGGREYAREVEILACVDKGVTSIAGIDELVSLHDVDLSINQIAEVGPAAKLAGLMFLKLADNAITGGVASLVALSELTELQLQGNPGIPCGDLEAVIDKLGAGVVKPSAAEPGVNCTP